MFRHVLCLWTGLTSDLLSSTVHSCCIKEWERGMLVTGHFQSCFCKLAEHKLFCDVFAFHRGESNSPLLLVTLHLSHYSRLLRLSIQAITDPYLHLLKPEYNTKTNLGYFLLNGLRNKLPFMLLLQFDNS